jgi:hypothetical protein
VVIAYDVSPFFEVITAANSVGAKLDDARASNALPSRIVDLAPKALLLRDSLVAPVKLRLLEKLPALSVGNILCLGMVLPASANRTVGRLLVLASFEANAHPAGPPVGTCQSSRRSYFLRITYYQLLESRKLSLLLIASGI